MQMITTVQSRCVRSLAYKVQSHMCSVQEADSTESAAALAFALTPLSRFRNLLDSHQLTTVSCNMVVDQLVIYRQSYNNMDVLQLDFDTFSAIMVIILIIMFIQPLDT